MRLRQLRKPAGSRALGATLTEVAPGAVSFPRHAHHANEEAIYVLSGSGEARIGEERVAVRPGDWIALPAGPSHAHQMVNSSATDPLVYLCVDQLRGRVVLRRQGLATRLSAEPSRRVLLLEAGPNFAPNAYPPGAVLLAGFPDPALSGSPDICLILACRFLWPWSSAGAVESGLWQCWRTSAWPAAGAAARSSSGPKVLPASRWSSRSSARYCRLRCWRMGGWPAAT